MKIWHGSGIARVIGQHLKVAFLVQRILNYVSEGNFYCVALKSDFYRGIIDVSYGFQTEIVMELGSWVGWGGTNRIVPVYTLVVLTL